jgi:hypothetical protein
MKTAIQAFLSTLSRKPADDIIRRINNEGFSFFEPKTKGDNIFLVFLLLYTLSPSLLTVTAITGSFIFEANFQKETPGNFPSPPWCQQHKTFFSLSWCSKKTS